jgi:hypothetical protein
LQYSRAPPPDESPPTDPKVVALPGREGFLGNINAAATARSETNCDSTSTRKKHTDDGPRKAKGWRPNSESTDGPSKDVFVSCPRVNQAHQTCTSLQLYTRFGCIQELIGSDTAFLLI